MLIVILPSCRVGGDALDRGDHVPEFMNAGDHAELAIAATVDDCLTCDLLGVFVALRVVQGSYAEGEGPDLVIFAITTRSDDTTYFRQTLERERLVGRIQVITPRAAAKSMNLRNLPTLYLVKEGEVVEKWERALEGPITIERDALVKLVSK